MCVSVVRKGAETESYARLCVCADVCVRVFVRKRKCAGVRAKTGGSPSGPTPQRRARERGVRAAANKSKCPWWPSSQCTAARPSCSAPELALAHTHTLRHTPTHTYKDTYIIHTCTHTCTVRAWSACVHEHRRVAGGTLVAVAVTQRRGGAVLGPPPRLRLPPSRAFRRGRASRRPRPASETVTSERGATSRHIITLILVTPRQRASLPHHPVFFYRAREREGKGRGRASGAGRRGQKAERKGRCPAD